MMNKLMLILEISLYILMSLLIYGFIKNNAARYKQKKVIPKHYIMIDNLNPRVNTISINNTEKKEPAMIPIQQTISNNDVEEENKVQEKEEYQLIELEGRIYQEEVDALQNEIYNTIPEWLLDSFIQHGWKVRLTSNDISKEYLENKYKSVMAMIQPSGKRIIISTRGIHESVAHEFGHYLDITFVYKCSNTEEFKQIYDEEVDIFINTIKNPGCVFNEAEFFAEAYYYSRVNPSKCTPKVLEYIERVSNQYKEGAHI